MRRPPPAGHWGTGLCAAAAAVLLGAGRPAAAGPWYGVVGLGAAAARVSPGDIAGELLTLTAPEGGYAVNSRTAPVTLAWQVAGGYRLTRTFALELGYTDFGRPTIDATVDTLALGPVSVHAQDHPRALAASALGRWPLARDFALTGRLGAAGYWASGEATFSAPGSTRTVAFSEYGASAVLGLGTEYRPPGSATAWRLEVVDYPSLAPGFASAAGGAVTATLSFIGHF